jgi:[ribosomal protein S5]-alanine N-acetyltransferase
MKAPERVETDRLVLRRPVPADAEAIFARYAGDPEVTKYVGWPRHLSVEHSRAFLHFSESEWSRWPAGPYLIEARTDQRLLGSTGLGFESLSTASTGYVLAKDSWGRGYATEALTAIVSVARELKVLNLYALCHPEHLPSRQVLEKCGFRLEQRLTQFAEFPNLQPGIRADCLRYVREAAGTSE